LVGISETKKQPLPVGQPAGGGHVANGAVALLWGLVRDVAYMR
jgi:hypothetical protein